jgi:hypothetical protein
MFAWCAEAVAAVSAIYTEELEVVLSSTPTLAKPQFEVLIGEGRSLNAAVCATNAREQSWQIVVCVRTETNGQLLAASSEHRSSQWSRASLEDLLLGILASYERARSRQL